MLAAISAGSLDKCNVSRWGDLLLSCDKMRYYSSNLTVAFVIIMIFFTQYSQESDAFLFFFHILLFKSGNKRDNFY